MRWCGKHRCSGELLHPRNRSCGRSVDDPRGEGRVIREGKLRVVTLLEEVGIWCVGNIEGHFDGGLRQTRSSKGGVVL